MSNLYPLLRPPRPAAPRRRRALAGSFAGALAALSLAAALLVPSSAAAAPPRQDPLQKPSVVAGMGVYIENCAPCHGVTGLGDGPTAPALDFPPANFADPEPAKTRTLTDMVATITDGRMDKLMPPWGARLSKEEIWDVAAYIQNLSVSPATLDAAAAAYAENCAECHGPQGDGAGVDFSQPAALTGDSLQTLFDRLRPAAGDHAPLADLPDETLWQSLIAVRNFGLELPVLDGVLRGQVTNGTTGQTGAGIALTLYALSPGGDPLQTFTAVSDADGAFSFNNLNRDHSLSYALEGAYLDISYFSAGPVVFVPGEREATLNLSVFETTPDPSAVYQSNLHRIMSFGAGWMSIADVYIFGNRGDRSFVGQPGEDGLPETVKIALPAEATNISFRNNTVRQIEDGSGTYLDSQPIPPGADVYTLFVTYDIPIEGKTKTVETPLFYSIQSVNVLATDQGQTIESPHLTLAGIESIQGNDYMRLTG
ncbi:MAG: c-type cytochrome, partial [Anaerolineae bacterium]